MANPKWCTNGKKCIFCNRELPQFPFQCNLLGSEMTHFSFRQVFRLLLPTTNLTNKTIQHQTTQLLTNTHTFNQKNPNLVELGYSKITLRRQKQKKVKKREECTWRALMPSLGTVLTWETILSSTQSMVMGILAPHLSQRAVIPHLRAMSPVRLELGVMTPGFAWRIGLRSSSLAATTSASELNRLHIRCVAGADADDGAAAAAAAAAVAGFTERRRRREMRPLDKADMALSSK